MKGLGRSICYWIYYMEKTLAVMMLTVAAVLTIQAMSGGWEMFFSMLRMYFPMMGSIFVIAILMSGASHFIPQAISNGGTRMEVFAGMELSIHLMLCEIALIAAVCGALVPKEYFFDGLVMKCMIIYFFGVGAGNLLCASTMKWGIKIGMIIYMVLVIGVSMSIGVIAAISNGTDFIVERISSSLLLSAGILFDMLTMAVCYLSIRRFEVR